MPIPCKQKEINTMPRIAKKANLAYKENESGTAKILRVLGLEPQDYDLFSMFSVEKRLLPFQAKQLLADHNPNNRPISSTQVSALQREMDMGRWSDDIGGVILFDTDGVLIDGQHRLMASAKSKKTIKFVFKFNRPKEDRDKIDQGRPRVTKDVLAMDSNILNGTHVPAIYKGALVGQALDFKSKADWDACCGVHRRNIKLSPADAKEVYEKYKDAFDFVTRLFHEPSNCYSKSGVIRGVFLRAYLNNPKRKDVLEKTVAYLSGRESDDFQLSILVEKFRGQFLSIDSKREKGKFELYGLTEKLIVLFSQDTSKWKGKIKLSATKDELFPFPAFDMRKPHDTCFVSGVERRRKIRQSLKDISNSFDDDMDDVA